MSAGLAPGASAAVMGLWGRCAVTWGRGLVGGGLLDMTSVPCTQCWSCRLSPAGGTWVALFIQAVEEMSFRDQRFVKLLTDRRSASCFLPGLFLGSGS